MLKNCSACKGRHAAPFGRYCRLLQPEYCELCVSRHEPPVGDRCPLHRRAELFITLPDQPSSGPTMAREVPISDRFKDRSDPSYLSFLEEQVEAMGRERKDAQAISGIVARLDALELSQHQRPGTSLAAAAGGGAVGGVPAGGTGSTADRGPAGASLHTPGLPLGVQADGSGLQQGAAAPVDPSLLPLTDALAQLTLAVDPAAGKAKGLLLRPEYYFQHVKSSTPIKQLDHTKLNYKELIYGWFCVIEHLMSKGGDLGGYVAHCKFVAEQAASGQFIDAAFVNYDRHVVSKVVDGVSATFTAGDMLGVASHLNAANLVINKNPVSQKTPSKQSRYNKWGRKSAQTSDKATTDSPPMPDGFPEDICYSYNYRSCTGKCSKKHICRVCKGDHQAKLCTKRE